MSTTSAPYFGKVNKNSSREKKKKKTEWSIETLRDSRPATPSQTTISSNNHDESLYLLWTQALLRERGFTDDILKKDETKEEDDSSVSDMSSVSSEEEEEEDKINIDHYIAEKRKLFSPAPSSLHAYSHRNSMVSHYSSVVSQSAVTEDQGSASTNSIYVFFRSCFSSCL